MIPRSYSRDLALQLNFIYDAARRSPERFEGNHRRQPRRPHHPSGFIWICRLEADTQMSFNTWHFSHSYVVLFTLAAFSAVLLVLPRPWFLSRHQSDEIPGRFLREDAAEDR